MIPPHCPDWERLRREELGEIVRIPRHLKDYEDDDFILYRLADYTPRQEEAQD